MSIQTFVAKPTRIQAIQWDGSEEGAKPIANWLRSATGVQPTIEHENPYNYLRILHGGTVMYLGIHEWLIKDTYGRFRVCSESSFAATFESL